MTADDLHRWKQPPPPRPRRRNVLLLRLYDAPIHRDPLAWWTLAWAVVSFAAILSPSPAPRTSGLPPLLDALLAMIVMTGLFAVLPAVARLQIRRVVWRRRDRRRTAAGLSTPDPLSDSGPIPRPAQAAGGGQDPGRAPGPDRASAETTQRLRAAPAPPPAARPGPAVRPAPPFHAGPPGQAPPGATPAGPAPSGTTPAGATPPGATPPGRTPPPDHAASAPTTPAGRIGRPGTPRPSEEPDPAQDPGGADPGDPVPAPDATDTPENDSAAAYRDSQTFVAESPELRRARSLQYPLARYVRTLQGESTAVGRYVVALDTAEVLATVLGMSAAAWLRHVGALPDRLSVLAEAYERGVAFGVWLDLARHTAKVAKGRTDAPAALTAFAAPATKAALGRLDTLVQERNRHAHGYRPHTEVEAERRLAEVLPALATALGGAADLREMPWVVTDSISLRASDRKFDVAGRRVMSDHPSFERDRWVRPTPLLDNRVYVMSERADPIDLTPFVAIRTCGTCLSEELFRATRLPRGGPTELKSFTNSHEVTDESLDEEIRSMRA